MCADVGIDRRIDRCTYVLLYILFLHDFLQACKLLSYADNHVIVAASLVFCVCSCSFGDSFYKQKLNSNLIKVIANQKLNKTQTVEHTHTENSIR